MAFDGFITGAMAITLNNTLAGGKIDRVFQPDKNDLVLYIYKDRTTHKLLLSANSSQPRLLLLAQDQVVENPKTPPAFTMLMRKHFRGGRIESINQHQSERIIEFQIVQRDELGYPVNKKLLIEIMGKHSNIIALDGDTNKILDSIKRISPEINRYRSVLPGVDYVYPPSQDKVPFYGLTEKTFDEIGLSDINPLETDLRDLSSKVQGLSPAMASEIMAEARISNRSVLQVLQDHESYILTGDYPAFVYLDDTGFPVDFHIFDLPEKSSVYKKKDFPDLNSCLQYYYSHKDLGNRIKQKSSDLVRHIGGALDKLYLKKERLNRDLDKAEKAEIYRLYGELLTSDLHNIERGAKSALVFNYYDNSQIEIPLDPRFSPQVNAKNYFKKYNKSKTAQKEKRVQIKETQDALAYLESTLVFAENAQLVGDLDLIREELIEEGFLNRRQKRVPLVQKAKYLSFPLEDRGQIRVGRNNKENDFLTFKQASKKDLWFHAKDIPGSHVILSMGGGKDGPSPDPELIKKAASLAAYHSKARDSANVAVDYTLVSNVKKIPGGRPGMVTYKNHKTIFVDPKETI